MNRCCVCNDDEIDVQGELGIIPVSFCSNCWGSLVAFIRETDGCIHGIACEHCALDEAE